MTTTLSSEWVTARKSHRCSVCAGTIPAGQRYVKWVTFDGGSAITSKAHQACDVILQWQHAENGWLDDELPWPWDFQSETLWPVVVQFCRFYLSGPYIEWRDR